MSERIEVILDDQGRLVLPSSLQRRLGLAPGTTLVVEQETAEAAYLRVQAEEPRLVDKQGVLVVQAQPSGDLANTVRDGRDRRVADLLRRADVRVLLDTSVLVAAMVEAHSAHEIALPWLQRVKAGTDSGIVAAHSVAELYAILTTLPVQPRISPMDARRLIERNVLATCEVVSLSEADYAGVIAHLASTGILGGTTYDALILHAAAKVEVDHIVTLNERDFRRVYPVLADKIVAP